MDDNPSPEPPAVVVAPFTKRGVRRQEGRFHIVESVVR